MNSQIPGKESLRGKAARLFDSPTISGNFSHDIDARTEINVRGVIALRSVAVSGQLLTILIVHGLLTVTLPLKLLFAVLGMTAILNVGLMVAHRYLPQRWPDLSNRFWQNVLGLTMLFDLAALAALLYLTGGISNPFCLFFFVNIILASILLPPNWVWSLTLFTVVCMAALNFWSIPLAGLDPSMVGGRQLPWGMSVYHLGSLIAYATCSTIIVYFITRIREQVELLEGHV